MCDPKTKNKSINNKNPEYPSSSHDQQYKNYILVNH